MSAISECNIVASLAIGVKVFMNAKLNGKGQRILNMLFTDSWLISYDVLYSQDVFIECLSKLKVHYRIQILFTL